jgi:hypothetical protein
MTNPELAQSSTQPLGAAQPIKPPDQATSTVGAVAPKDASTEATAEEINLSGRQAVERWSAAAASMPSGALPIPVSTLATEAVRMAQAMRAHWASKLDAEGKVLVSGFATRTKTPLYNEATPAELEELAEALRTFATSKSLISQTGESVLGRAQTLLGELRSHLQFTFDDGVDDEADLQLAALQERFGQVTSCDDVTVALESYARVAQTHLPKATEISGLQPATVQQAWDAAMALRAQKAANPRGGARDEMSEVIALRNRLGALLLRKMRAVRRAARFLFRGHPDLIREFTSTYERSRRMAASRRHKLDAAGESIAPVSGVTSTAAGLDPKDAPELDEPLDSALAQASGAEKR